MMTVFREFIRQNPLAVLALAVVFAVGIWLRLYALDTVPSGLSQDEAFNSLSGLLSFEQNEFRLFYMQGSWALSGPFIWMLGLAIELFGNHLWSIRFVPAFIGVLTLVSFYLLCMEYWRGNPHRIRASILATALLAISYWHLHTTRLIFHGTLAPLCEVLTLWSLLVAFRKQSMGYYVLAGAVSVLGIYSYWQYLPFMLLPACMILYRLYHKKITLKHVAVYAICALIISAPFVVVSMQQNVFYRINQLKVTNQISEDKSPLENSIDMIQEVKKNAAYTIGMLFLDGDRNWRHNYNRQAAIGLLSQLGLIFALIYLLGRQTEDRLLVSMLWGWFVVAMLPAILTSQAVPHSWRSNAMILPVSMLSAYGLNYALYAIRKFRYRNMVYTLLGVSFLVSGYMVYDGYFVKWGQDRRTKAAFNMRYINSRYEGYGPYYRDIDFVREALTINVR